MIARVDCFLMIKCHFERKENDDVGGRKCTIKPLYSVISGAEGAYPISCSFENRHKSKVKGHIMCTYIKDMVWVPRGPFSNKAKVSLGLVRSRKRGMLSKVKVKER